MGAKQDRTPRVAEFISNVRDLCRHVLAPFVRPEDLPHAADAVLTSILAHYAGAYVYVPKMHAIETSRRDRAIFDAYEKAGCTPAAIHALAQECGVSEIGLYGILARERARRRAERQRPTAAPPSSPGVPA